MSQSTPEAVNQNIVHISWGTGKNPASLHIRTLSEDMTTYSRCIPSPEAVITIITLQYFFCCCLKYIKKKNPVMNSSDFKQDGRASGFLKIITC